jgi:hypothetical protein
MALQKLSESCQRCRSLEQRISTAKYGGYEARRFSWRRPLATQVAVAFFSEADGIEAR